MNHATFKASLFMAAGIIDHEAGTRDMRKLNGLWKYMPYTAVLAMVARPRWPVCRCSTASCRRRCSSPGPSIWPTQGTATWLPIAQRSPARSPSPTRYASSTTCSSTASPIDLPRKPHEPPRWMKLPVEILVVICLAVGIVPAWTFGPLLATAAGATLQAELPDLQPGDLAWLQPGAGDEPGRPGRRHRDLPTAPTAVPLA
jgi:multicomponent K+:H+ antiporter subunit A